MTSELDAIIEDLGKLRRYLSREKYIDETVYEVYPKDLAAELATRWAAFIKRGTDSKVKLDPVAVAQVAKSFRALREFADRQVMRSRYDREIKAILKATERWQISPKGTVTPPLQPIASPPLPAKPAGVTRRVFISMPSDEGLSDVQNKIKWGIVRKIADAGYEPQIFTGPSGGVGLPAGKAWTFTEVDAVMRRCCGAALIGIAKWRVRTKSREILLPTEYAQYEGAVALTYQLPVLAVLEEGVEPRGVFNRHGFEISHLPANAGLSWPDAGLFLGPFTNWTRTLGERFDVFLGYCGSSRQVAVSIKRFLQAELGLKVLDWHDGFTPGTSILNQIELAAVQCSVGIFLFTRDDKLEGAADAAAPRDNVIFESGYFAHSRGKDRVLIVREEGAKMPADLGGDIYVSLSDRANIEPTEVAIRRFILNRL